MKLYTLFLYTLIIALYPYQGMAAFSDLSITEIMYNFDGADTKREWVELHNNGADAITILTGSGDESVRVYEEHGSTKHSHTFATEAYQGSKTISSGDFAIIAQDGAIFKSLFPSYSGTIFTVSAVSFSNTAQVIGLKIGSAGAVWSSVAYLNSWGANGDGKSLQLQNGQWIADSPTPGIGTKSQNSGGGTGTQVPASSNATVQSSNEKSSGSLSFPTVKPRFTVSAGDDQTVIAGAEARFFGRVLGFDGKPLDGGRFLWNFGDGTIGEGRSIVHIFRFPGTYITALSVSSEYEAVSDYATITAVPNPVFISEVAVGKDGFVEISNTSSVSLDIGSWIIRNETSGAKFVIPSGTKINSHSAIAFSTEIMAFDITGVVGESIALFYPNLLTAGRVIVRAVPENKGSFLSFSDGSWSLASTMSPGVLDSAVLAMPTKEGLKTPTAIVANGQKNQQRDNGATEQTIKNILNISQEEKEKKQEMQQEMPRVVSDNSQLAIIGSSTGVYLGVTVFVSMLGAIGFFFVRKIFFL